MKNMKYNMTFGIALVCAMLFTACDTIADSPKSKTPVGKISISFAGEEMASQTAEPSMARTVLPSTVFYRYTYTFTKEGEESGVVKAPGNDGFFTLEVGSYTVEVQAFTGDAEPYTLAASGVSSAFNVGSGSNAPVEIILTAVGTESQGEFNYTITYPADAAAEIILQKWPELDNITLNPTNLSEGNGKTQTLQLETGSYLLTVLVKKTGLYAGISEAVHIYSSLATVYTKGFDDNDLLVNPTPTTPDFTISGTGTFTYDGDSKTVTIEPLNDKSTGTITVLYNGTGTLPVNAGTYTVTFNVAETEDWNAADGLSAGTITINRAAGAAVSAPDGTSSVTGTSITINAVPAPENGQTVEYARNTSNSAPSSGWQTGTTFSSLTAGTTYYFFVRSAQNTNYNAGTASSGYSVTTPSYRISLNPTSNTFTAATFGYGTQSTRSVTVSNTGNQATGELTVALSGTNASTNFTLSTTSINNIAAGGNTSFTVRPNTGLNAGTYTATVTVSGSNSISATLSVSFTVNRATGAAVSALTTSSVTSTSITVNAVTAPTNGQTVEYARNTSNSAPSSGWQAGTTFSDLTPGTTYYFFARSAQNTNYNAGTASSVQVATPALVGTENNPIPLTENLWEDGSITVSGGEVWYSFTVAANTEYRVWWNQQQYTTSYGDGTKTARVNVTAYDSNRTQQFSTTNGNAAWSTPQTIAPKTSGTTIKLRVTLYSNSTGTFAVGYSTGSARSAFRIRPPVSHTPITANQWTDGSITSSNREIWYSFTATANTNYGVWWNDSSAGDKSKTLDIQVRAYDSTGAQLFSVDDSWTFNMNSTFNIASGGTVYLRVLSNNGVTSGTGTFAIGYSTGFIRWDIGCTALTANQWANGTIGTWGETWYSFTVAANTEYRVWWNQQQYTTSYGDGTKTARVNVTAYDSNRTQQFSTTNGNAAWSTPQTIAPKTSGTTFYLRVTRYSGSDTFGIVYSTGSTRPAVP